MTLINEIVNHRRNVVGKKKKEKKKKNVLIWLPLEKEKALINDKS